MLRQAENHVQIVGKLMENNLDYRTYMKDNKEEQAIGGTLNVKVDSLVNGIIKPSIISINVFTRKFKNNGEENPIFASMETAKKDYKSAAATGSEDEADYIRTFTGDGSVYAGSFNMNTYMGRTSTRISSNFINRVTAPTETYANFTCEVFVRSITEEIKDDVPTGRLILHGAMPQYNGKVDFITFVIEDPVIVNIANSYWTPDSTIIVAGSIRNYTEEVVKTIENEDWIGETKPRTITTTVNEFVITGGQRSPLDIDSAFDPIEMREAINQRLAEIEEQSKIKVNTTKKESQHIGSNRGF